LGEGMAPSHGAKTLDVRGKFCPMPIVVLSKEIRALSRGATLVMLADDPAFPADVEAWCTKTGNVLLSLTSDAGHYCATVRKEVAG